ncbi:hypothetical protein AB5N19_08464 [Seiridium cardinale]
MKDDTGSSARGSHRYKHHPHHSPINNYTIQGFEYIHLNGIDRVPFFLHPLALNPRINLQHGVENHAQRTVAKDPMENTSAPAPANKALSEGENSLAEEKLAQAAKQYYDQTKESQEVFEAFHEEYTNDIKSVRRYTSDDVRRVIWEGKVERNMKYKDGLGKEDKQLGHQQNKLKTCLARFREAADDVATKTPSTNDHVHDSRGLQLEKVLAAGERVDRLVCKALLDEIACKDLVNELQELLNLIDPRKPQNSPIYRFDKRQFLAEPSGNGDGEHDKAEKPNDGNGQQIQGNENWTQN